MRPPGRPDPEVPVLAELLLPLFVLTLLANAVLVGAAIRGMRRGSGDPGRAPASPPSKAGRTAAGPAAAAAPGAPGATASPAASPAPDEPATDGSVDPATSPTPGLPVHAGAGDVPLPERSDPPATGHFDAAAEPAPAKRATASRPARAAKGGAATAPASPPVPSARVRSAAGASGDPAPPSRRGRRRFSLPPLDEDHERTSRSIETFLGGPDGPPADPTLMPQTAAEAANPGATTVAIVAIDGLRPRRRSRRAVAPRPAAGDPPVEQRDAVVDAPAMVERTLRGAARGSDAVSVGRTGRFRVIMPGTGELAARAYLRRVRASVEPILEASDDPLRLVIATATALGGPVDDAIRTAERRMVVLLETASERAASPTGGGTGPEAGRPGAPDEPVDQAAVIDEGAGPRAAPD